MKDLEEKAEELYNSIAEPIDFNTGDCQELMHSPEFLISFASQFAQEERNAALQEAAEKIPIPVNPYTLEPQDGLDDATIIHLEREYLKALKIKEYILSLMKDK